MRALKKHLVFICVFLFTCSFIACKDISKSNESSTDTTTLYFIRHAEKDRSDSANSNPSLTEEGIERAKGWAAYFKDKELDAVYSTDYNRTLQTAEFTAKQEKLTIQKYSPTELITEEFLTLNKGKKILIVGHSNTTPLLVNLALKEDKYQDIPDNENNNLFIVSIKQDTRTSTVEKIN